MGKTYKHNSYHKPKQHGRVFDKQKSKWRPKKNELPKEDIVSYPPSEFIPEE